MFNSPTQAGTDKPQTRRRFRTLFHLNVTKSRRRSDYTSFRSNRIHPMNFTLRRFSKGTAGCSSILTVSFLVWCFGQAAARASISPTTLPTGGNVVQGNAPISTSPSGSQMTINQTTDPGRRIKARSCPWDRGMMNSSIRTQELRERSKLMANSNSSWH